MVTVQIFGLKNSSATRAAERFFKERSIQIHFVDLKIKPMSPGEIRRFVDRFKLDGLIDREGKAWTNASLQYMKMADSELLAKIEKDPALLRLPFIRCGNLISIGQDETTWKTMAAS